MATTRQPHKRRRSAIACVNCHDRKVRCNAAFSGIPCSNCQQDGVPCEVYGRRPSIRSSSRRPIQPRPLDERSEPTSLLTPSTPGLDTVSEEAGRGLSFHDRPSSNLSSDASLRRQSPAGTTLEGRDAPSTQIEGEKNNVVPYYAGESEGLEFIFDICAPNRALKGPHYIVNRQVHKREHLRDNGKPLQTPFPDSHVRQELLRCYFHYVHPFLPVVDVHTFFHKYTQGIQNVSSVLLWSMFFTGANFISPDTLKGIRFSSRKSFKEYCYQRARELFESQKEPDKTALIQSAILIALWYVELEDRDGTWHWMGIAITLCHTIGLHRASNIDLVPRCPFTPTQRAVWKRIWWCCYYREAFAALGFGRPMRINIDDCDLPLPTTKDVLADIQYIPHSLIDTYLPPDRERLATLWINLLQLSMHLERVLSLHYRPRRPLLSLSQLEEDDANLWRLRESAPTATDLLPTTSLLHAHHLQCYFNAVIIALYRPYVLKVPEHLVPSQRGQLRSVAQQRVKEAAANTTSTINKLVSLDLIDLAGNMLVTTIMAAAQIHLFEIGHSEGLARQYASHHFNLHVLVLAQLRGTYWTADHQHKLFTETLKALEDEGHRTQLEGQPANHSASVAPGNDSVMSATPSNTDQCNTNEGQSLEHGAFGSTGRVLEDFFLSFNPNPFISLPTDFDPGSPGDWVLGTETPLNLEPSA